jgi:hypothetical protein
MIGQAECCLYKANALVSLYKERLKTSPDTLFGIAPED